MKKIAFDIKYKPQIESGEYKVETKNGHPVRIICWDTNMEWPICALIKDRNPNSTYCFPDLFDEKGKCIDSKHCDLNILINESELEYSERIRIGIKNCIVLCEKNGFITDDVTEGEAIAWIDKLDKQKSAEWSKEEIEQEWSEEDERLRTSCIKHIEEELESIRNDKYGHSEIISNLKESCRERINWLKSLRPQKRWRPNNEQMNALKEQCVNLKSTHSGSILCELYNKLKKL